MRVLTEHVRNTNGFACKSALGVLSELTGGYCPEHTAIRLDYRLFSQLIVALQALSELEDLICQQTDDQVLAEGMVAICQNAIQNEIEKKESSKFGWKEIFTIAKAVVKIYGAFYTGLPFLSRRGSCSALDAWL